MRTLLHTEFASLLARADAPQVGFARLAGVTARQVVGRLRPDFRRLPAECPSRFVVSDPPAALEGHGLRDHKWLQRPRMAAYHQDG
jgi:hypothetical protein